MARQTPAAAAAFRKRYLASKIKPRARKQTRGHERSVVRNTVLRAPNQAARRFSAEDLPVFPLATSSKKNLLSLVKAGHPCAFDCADMYEDILAGIIWLDESVSLLAIEPLHGSFRHVALLSDTCVLWPRLNAAGLFEIWRKVVQSDADARRGQVSGPSSMAAIWGTTVWTARLTAIPGGDDHSCRNPEKARSRDVTPRAPCNRICPVLHRGHAADILVRRVENPTDNGSPS